MFFFFNDTATTEIYTLSLHDALPISSAGFATVNVRAAGGAAVGDEFGDCEGSGTLIVSSTGSDSRLVTASDRKSTRLNSSHANISYAVFCLKKKTTTNPYTPDPILLF